MEKIQYLKLIYMKQNFEANKSKACREQLYIEYLKTQEN